MARHCLSWLSVIRPQWLIVCWSKVDYDYNLFSPIQLWSTIPIVDGNSIPKFSQQLPFFHLDSCISFNQYVTPTNKTTHANFANHPTTRMRIAQFLCPSSLWPKIRISRSEILDFQREGSISSLVLDRCYLKVKIWKFVGCIAMHHSAKKCSLSTFSANNSHA